MKTRLIIKNIIKFKKAVKGFPEIIYDEEIEGLFTYPRLEEHITTNGYTYKVLTVDHQIDKRILQIMVECVG